MRKVIIYSFCLVALFTSCEDVIDVDLNDSAPRLVIEASFNVSEVGEQTQARVKLTQTTPFFNTEPIFVNDAEVRVIDNSGNITEINLFQDGIYNAPLVIDPEATYTLEIVHNGETYTATERYIPTVPLEFVEQENDSGFSGEEIDIKAFFTDPGGEENFYLFEGLSERGNMIDAYKDEFFDGNQIFGLYSAEDLEEGDEVTLKLYGVDEQFYNFIFVLLQQGSDDSGGPFETQPATVRGNLVNTTNPDNFPLGYFRISQVSTLQYTVQ